MTEVLDPPREESRTPLASEQEAREVAEAARENGASRVFAGIHFATAVQAGYEQGERIGAWTYERALRPVKF